MKSEFPRLLLGAILMVAAAPGAAAASPPAYILNGYSFGGFTGVNTDELEARLKDHEGARITDKDVAIDEAMLTRELAVRGIKGRLFTTLAEKQGRVWVIFDLQKPRLASPGAQNRRLELQQFEGDTAVSAGVLSAATGLKPGDAISSDRINAARTAIVAAYEKAVPGKTPTIRGRMQVKADGGVVLTWMISEQK